MTAVSLLTRVARHVKYHPGLTCAEIATALESTPGHVSIELRALVKDGRIKGTGNTRGKRYKVVT